MVGEDVAGEKAAQDSNGGLKNLRLRINIEGNIVDNVLDGIGEARRISKNDKGIEDVNESEGEVACYIIVCDVGS